MAGSEMLVGTYQHWDMYPSGWGGRLLGEAAELTARGDNFLQHLSQSAANTTKCDWRNDPEDHCYWNHRPYISNEKAHAGKDFHPSFEVLASLKEVYPPSLGRDTDIEYAYWWDVEEGVLVAEAGPLGSRGGTIIEARIDLASTETSEAFALDGPEFETWLRAKWRESPDGDCLRDA